MNKMEHPAECPRSMEEDEIAYYLENYHNHYPRESIKDVQFRLTRGLVFAARKWRKLANERLRDVGQSEARWEALFMTTFAGGMLPQSRFAELLSIEGPTIARMLDGLEKEGLIERSQDENDRRQTRNVLTTAGKKAVDETKAITDEIRTEVLRDISLKDIDVTLRVLQQVIERIDTMRGETGTLAALTAG